MRSTCLQFVFKCSRRRHKRQNWSFHAVERTGTTAKCTKNEKKNASAKRAKVLFFIRLLNMQICEVLVAFVVVLA